MSPFRGDILLHVPGLPFTGSDRLSILFSIRLSADSAASEREVLTCSVFIPVSISAC